MPARQTPASAPRRYLGITAAERRAQRRERLLEAGLELFGTRGYAATAVRDVCAAASLNTRYFYESFKSNEDLLFQVYEGIIAEMSAAVIEVTAGAATIEGQARAGLLASWGLMAEDPRKARVVAVEVVGASERLERVRRRDRHMFADILVRNAMSLAEPNVKLRFDPVLNARALMGATIEVLGDWVNGELDASVDEIVDYLTHLYTTATYAMRADAADGRTDGRERAGRVRAALDGAGAKPAGSRRTASKLAASKPAAPKPAASAADQPARRRVTPSARGSRSR
jgi:AcrR family transcriptional regulator